MVFTPFTHLQHLVILLLLVLEMQTSFVWLVEGVEHLNIVVGVVLEGIGTSLVWL